MLVSRTSTNQNLRQDPDAVVLVEQIRLLYGAPIIVLINPVNASIVAVLLWQMYSAWVVFGWLGFFLVVTGARMLLAHRYRRQQQTVHDAEHWGRFFSLGAVATGCLWGLLVSITYVTADPFYYVFVVFVLGGMTAGAAMQSSAYLPAFYGFAAPAGLPMIVVLLAKGSFPLGVMALLLITFSVVLVFMARDNNRRIVENVRLRIGQTFLNEELQRHGRDMSAVARMSDMLQSCRSRAEAYPIIVTAANNLFCGTNGAIAFAASGMPELETVVQWGADQTMLPQFSSDDCWALRGGQKYEISDPVTGTVCRHFREPPRGPYLCLPLTAQGEMSGLLHLNVAPGGILSEELHWQMLSFGDVVKLSLSNLKLRETLSEQAMRDQLTGLFNRHYLAETLPREIHRAQRNNTPLSMAMMDIDNFKSFNDTHGHDAGDLVLKELGVLLRDSLRAGDIACRYGGEEFLMVLPECDLCAAQTLLQQICSNMGRKTFVFQKHALPAVTMSVGLSQLDRDLSSQESIISAADDALYNAKRDGRNRIEIFSRKIFASNGGPVVPASPRPAAAGLVSSKLDR